ncbi:GNAT family N-acetyltransferase [Stappia indica]|uniref:GNAT family N-acetyltransferase n=1 Tax=Stappia indica TaxID=538381 RepID=UPI001D18F979|nr:N-acetyltransferase [Stappia indica]MCC4244343.1 N-acetyltransferase [Stappia indica]
MTHPALEPAIRPATPADEADISLVTASAFGQEGEARLVDELRSCGALVLELVAVDRDGRIVGHVAFSRVTGAGAGHRLAISCLAPVSVSPDRQRGGVGSALIRAGITALREQGEDLVLVLGPPAYYPRFGFDAELAKKVAAPYAGAAFQALALTEAARAALPIEVTFATPFEAFE